MHLEALARDGDPQAIAELHYGPQLPPLAQHLWLLWLDLCSTRSSNGFGLNPLTRHDLHAWEADEGGRLDPWERRVLFRIDAAYRASLIPES